MLTRRRRKIRRLATEYLEGTVFVVAYLSPPLSRGVCVDGQLTIRTGYALFGPDAAVVADRMRLPDNRRYHDGRWKLWPEELERALEVGAVQLTHLEYKAKMREARDGRRLQTAGR